MPRFTIPRDIYYGRESIERLSSLRGKRAMLIAASSEMEQGGFLRRAEETLLRTGMKVCTLEFKWPSKVEETAAEGASALRTFAPDWIVALGSTTIGMAKLMWVLYEYPEAALDDLRMPYSLPALRRKARFAAVPTLGSNAQEATAFAEIAGSEEHAAWAVVDYGLVPDLALIDPELSAAASPETIAQAGAEALANALDAYAACIGAPLAEPAAQKASGLIFEHLQAARMEDGFAREQIQYAQCLSGLAFSNVNAGLTHALVRQTIALFPACRAHAGTVCGIFLPHVIRFNMREARVCARYATLARALGLRGRLDTQAAEALAEEVETLCRGAELPGNLQEIGLAKEAFEQYRRTAAMRIVSDPCTAEGPRRVTDGDAELLLAAAFG